MAGSQTEFLERARGAVQDGFLQQALTTATTRFITLRGQAFQGLPGAEALRERARAIKERTIRELDRYLEQLAASVRKAGGVVHWASDAHQARDIILGIAREGGVRLAVKSKSMASEEIHLNAALEGAGIRVVETDLGEWIIQLARETPSHIIAPAIHKTKGQVAELISKRVGEALPPDPEVLTAVARRELRQEFLQADIGISGVNFAVAETGTLVIVTNEGNGRLVTSLPRVHIALMGMEKVIPTLADLPAFLELLPRSATGQKISSYVTMVRGPRRPPEVDGPEELHLVIMDNGRSRQVGGPLEESLYCLRCGACLNVCPVYREVGGHAYGSVYPGPIGIILTSYLGRPGEAKNLAGASTLCGACQDACPVKINIPRMLLELRAEAAGPAEASWTERAAFRALAWLLTSPGLYRLAARLGRLAQRPYVRDGRIQQLPGPLDGWTRFRTLRPLADRPFHRRLPSGDGGEGRGR